MPFVYFLFSEKDQKWYVGQTQLTLEARFKRHMSGHVKSTRNRRPFVLAYSEEFKTSREAAKREWHLKHIPGYKEKLQIIEELLMNRLSWPRRGPLGFRAPH